MRHWLTIALVAVAPRAAQAGGVVEEVAAGATPVPGSRWLSDKLAGIWDVDERWQLRLDLSSTRVYSEAADTTPGDVYLASLSAVYSSDEHWSLRLSGGWSPGSTTRATSAIDLEGLAGMNRVDATLHAITTSYAFGVGIDYDSATAGLHSLSGSLSAGVTYFNADQATLSVRDAGGATFDPAELLMRCDLEACSGDVRGKLASQSVQLDQLAVTASITDTVERDTDLSLDASYFVYDQDPLQSGYVFALTTFVTSTLGSASGAPLLRDSFTPSVAHRWERVAATLSLSYSDYVDGREFDVGASVRVQYKVALAGSQRLKIFAKLAVGSHADARVEAHPDTNLEFTRSGSAGLGAQYTW